MKNRYIFDGKINFSDLRHDIRALLVPFEMTLKNLVHDEKRGQAILMQLEIYKGLEKILTDLEKFSGCDDLKLNEKGL